jgi:hypothetical protein
MRPLAPSRHRIRHALLTAPLLLVLGASLAHAQNCTPAACGGSHHVVTFEGLTTGATVEGLGAVDPHLAITSVPWPLGPACPTGSARVIEVGNPLPYSAYDSGGVPNACLDGSKGFSDDANCALDYDFTFASGVTVSCFSIHIYDFGDYFPYGGTLHQVFLTAYDASNTQIDQAVLTVTGDVTVSGDACVSQAGMPGNYALKVSGAGITRVALTYDAVPDPNVGYDDIAFCEESSPTPATHPSWGRVKILHRG